MIHLPMRPLVAVLVLSALFVGGCGTSPPSRFYLMTPLPEADAPAPAGQREPGSALGVGPVKLPAYLDRPEVVTRSSPNALQVAEFDRWAEPLEENFTRVLAMNLAVLAGTHRISIYPWPRSAPLDYQVTVTVDRFDAGANSQVVLVARWHVLGGEEGRFVRSGRTVATQPVATADYEALAGVMSTSIATLAREIAAAIPVGVPGTQRGR
jgi:uncharacterized protein